MAVRAVYSQRFLVQKGLNGAGPSVVVPPGFVYVVKQITMYSSPLLAPVHGFLEDTLTGAALFSGSVSPPDFGWVGFFGQLVFEVGQAFNFQVDSSLGDAMDVYCGGYTLTNP